MTEVARLLLEGHRRGCGRFPRQLFGRRPKSRSSCRRAFPNLLANGSQGIAVGMATSIPPHNVAELCDAALYLIAHPERRRPKRLPLRAGAGFPDRRRRRRRQVRDHRNLPDRPRRLSCARALDEGGDAAAARWVAVVTEIPYGVPEVAADRADRRSSSTSKKLPLLADVRDEIDRGRAHRASSRAPARSIRR